MLKASIVGAFIGTLVLASAAKADDTCPGKSQNRQTHRLGALLGGLGEGLVTQGLNRAGINPDASYRATMRGYLSDAIACALSPKEQQQAADAQTGALQSGRTGANSRQTWKSTERSNVSGGSIVESRSQNNGQNCAVTRTFVTDENGKEQSVEAQRCQGPDGRWS